MTLKMIGRIYKIVCNVTGLTYIGSTGKTVQKRIATHIKNNNTSAKPIIERGDYRFELIEEVIVVDKTHLHQIEAMHIKSIPCVNRLVPYRSKEEKRELKNQRQSTEQFKEYTRNFYKKYNSKFTPTQCACGGHWTYPCNISKHYFSKIHTEWEQQAK